MLPGICLVSAAGALSILNGIYLKKRDARKRKEAFSIKQLRSCTKGEYIYFLAMLAGTVGTAVVLRVHYNNGFAHDFMRVCLISLLWPAAKIDFKEKIIPNDLLKIGCVYWVAGLVLSLFSGWNAALWVFLRGIVAMAGIALVCLICILAIKNCIGMGDIKLFMIMGLMQGVSGLVSSVIMSMMVSFFLCIFGLAAKKIGRKDTIPFAPSILIGATISIILKGM